MYRSIADRHNVPVCGCGDLFSRVLDSPMVMPELNPYHSPTDGRLISSREERRKDLQRSKAIAWEPGIEKDIARRKEDQINDSFKPIAAAVDTIVRDLNTSGKLEQQNA